MDGITKPMLDALETTAWGMRHFGSIVTNRQLPLSVMRQCVKAGLCRCVGMGELCDGDGFTEYDSKGRTKMRLGYQLTEAGRAELDKFYSGIGCSESLRKELADLEISE